MQNLEQIKAVIKNLKTIVAAMESKRLDAEAVQNVQMAANEVNFVLYHSEKLNFQKEYDIQNDRDYSDHTKEIAALITLWEQSMEKRTGNSTDTEFWEIYEYFKYVDVNVIFQMVVQHFMKLSEGMRIEYLSLPYRYSFLQNKLDFYHKDFSLVRQHIEVMSEEVEKYKWLYERVADNTSREIINGIISYWLKFDMDILGALEEKNGQFVGMDIQKENIMEMAEHIKAEKPGMKIPVYRSPEDMFVIPHLINDIRDDYEFYIRFNGHDCLWPFDYYLYAI